jgi:tetratricopeptide (TPR) repeat protein
MRDRTINSVGAVPDVGIDDLDARMEPHFRKGNYREALADLTRLRDSGRLTRPAEIASAVAEVNCLLFLEGAAQARRVLERASRLLANLPEQFKGEAGRLRVSVLASDGLTTLVEEDPQRARVLLEEADAGYAALGLSWQRSGVLVNLALAAIMSSEFRDAAKLLDRAELVGSDPDLAPDRRREREVALVINRSSLRSILGEVRGAVEELQSLRPRVEEEENWHMLARLDLNLSTIYFQMDMLGSSLEAARSGAKTYERIGLRPEVFGAEAVEGKVLAKLGRTVEAEEKLEKLRRLADEADGNAPWLDNTLVGLVIVYRATGRSDEADVLDAELAPLRQGVREIKLTTEVFDEITGYIDGWMRGEDLPVRLTAPTLSAIGELRESQSPIGPAIAEVAELFFSALIEGNSVAPLAEANAEFLRTLGVDIDQLRDVIEAGIALRARDDHRLLLSSLSELVRHQRLASLQEAAEYRQGLLAGRGGTDLLTALLVCLRRNRFDILFELIEWCRRDLGEIVESDEEGAVRSFPHLSRGVATTALDVPGALSVKRGSALRSASQAVDVIADADDIREGLGGRHAAWLTAMRFEDHVYWSLLTSGAVHGGRVPFASLEPALAAHRESLPVPLETDVASVGPGDPPWCVQTVATARASISGLLRDPDLFGECLRALPGPLADRILSKGPPSSGDAMTAYKALGRHLVPDALERYLDAVGARARLIVSVQPELASIPFGLLGTRTGESLLERTPIIFAPPKRTAAAIVGRANLTGPVRDAFSVVNPTDDLADISLTSAVGHELRGWAGAQDDGEIASAEHCAMALRDLDSVGRAPGRMAFFGHIRPGEPSEPGSASLVLSPSHLGGRPERLSATDFIAMDLPAPARVYLGGCEGVGFDTGLEWASVSAALLVQGASIVLAHGWPVVEGPQAAEVDRACVEGLDRTSDVAEALRDLQVTWLRKWRRGEPDAVPPYYWAGLHAIGRARPEAHTS